jgi:hypothetical protein
MSGLRNPTVNDSSGHWVRGAICVSGDGRIEASVVTLADHDNGHMREAAGCGASRVNRFTSLFEQGELLSKDKIVLAFRDTVTVDNNIFRVLVLVMPGPIPETGLQQGVKIGDHFLFRTLDAKEDYGSSLL